MGSGNKEIRKGSEEWVVKTADCIMRDLVRHKFDMKRQYEYYKGIRNKSQYAYLEENFGIGSPTSVEFTPIIKNHIDYLCGLYCSVDPKYRILCRDKASVDGRAKELSEAVRKARGEYIGGIIDKMRGEAMKGEKVMSAIDRDVLGRIDDVTSEGFVSSFERAGQDAIEYIRQSKGVSYARKRETMMLDALIAGMNFYRWSVSRSGDNVRLEVYNPMNVFYDKSPDSPYVRDCRRIVVRRWMTRSDIINEWGDRLTKGDIEDIENMKEGSGMYDRIWDTVKGDGMTADDKELIPGYPYDEYYDGEERLIPVYEVTWLDYDRNDGKDPMIPTDKYAYVTYRYKCIRIGSDINIVIGKDDVYDRSTDNPSECGIGYGGVFMLDRTDKPFSLMRACMHLQDKYDVIGFVRDAALANNGSIGSYLDVSQLPKFLGTDMTEKIEKWIAYTRTGVKLIDTSQEGQQVAPNTVYQSYDETIRAEFVEAIDTVLERVEGDVSKISGVFPSRLGKGGEYQVGTQRDEERIVIQIAKRYFSTMDMSVEECFLSGINVAKVAWPEGRHGSVLVGSDVKSFNIIPESFCVTSYDLCLMSTADSLDEGTVLQDLVKSLIQNQSLDMQMLPDILMCKSITEMSSKIKEGIARQMKYTEKIDQLTKQVEEYKGQVDELTKRNEELEKTKDNYNMERLRMERERSEEEIRIKWFEANNKAETDRSKIELERKKGGIR